VRPPAWLLPLPNSPPPTCACEGGICSLNLLISEGLVGEIGLQAGQELVFELSAVNPSGPVDVVDNSWMAQHVATDGTLRATASVTGWSVFGQLRDLSVYITGFNTRAGSYTELAVKFIPAVWSSVMELVVHEPSGFDFTRCIPISPLLVEREKTQGARLVIIHGDWRAKQEAFIPLSDVLLGVMGGQTRISIRLFEDDLLDSVVAERLNYLQGFRAPGSFQIVEQYLWSEKVVAHHEAGAFDEVLPYIPPHSGKPARLTLLFNVTNAVPAGESLLALSAAESDVANLFEPRVDEILQPKFEACARGGHPGTCKSPTELGFSSVQLISNDGEDIPYAINFTLNGTSPIEAARLYRLSFWCIPSSGVLYWDLSTQDGGALPTNTNDASDPTIGAVEELSALVELFAARSPPQAVVPVRITIFAGESAPASDLIRVILPRGYVRFGMTQPADPENAARIVINVERSAGVGNPYSDEGWSIELQVVTPDRNISDTRWFVFTSGIDRDEWGRPSLSYAKMTAWGVAPGFTVAANIVRLAYGSVPLFSGWLSITFQLPSYMRGKYALVSAPEGFVLSCPEGANAEPLVCSPFVRLGMVASMDLPRTTNITLPAGAAEGTNRLYSLMLGISTPETLASESVVWHVRIVDGANNIVDSALNIPGRAWRRSMVVQNPTLAWATQPQGGEPSNVVIEITFETRVRQILALLISLPERYRHDIQHPNQLKNVNKHLPLAVDLDWANYDNVRWVRLLLVTGTPGSTIDFVPAGTFQFEFPVMIPVEQPASMEWYFSLCSSFNCQDPDDRHVSVAFPMPNTRPILPARVYGTGWQALTADAAPIPCTRCSVLALVLALSSSQALCKRAKLA